MDLIAISMIASATINAISPYLQKVGDEAAKSFGKDVYEKLRLTFKGKTAAAESLDTLERRPEDENARAKAHAQLLNALANNENLVRDLEFALRQKLSVDEKPSTTRVSQTLHTQGSSVIAPINSTFSIGGSLDMRTQYGPTVEQIREKEEIDRIRSIIDQFNRAAVYDQMHEETIGLMCRSLNDLRINVQKMGSGSLSDPSIRLLLDLIQGELREIVALALAIPVVARGSNWRKSILDIRIFGSTSSYGDMRGFHHGIANEAETNGLKIRAFVRKRLVGCYAHARDIDVTGIPTEYPEVEAEAKRRGIEPCDVQQTMMAERQPDVPLDLSTLSTDIAVLYCFGAIDQLKKQLAKKIQLLESHYQDRSRFLGQM